MKKKKKKLRKERSLLLILEWRKSKLSKKWAFLKNTSFNKNTESKNPRSWLDQSYSWAHPAKSGSLWCYFT